MYTLSRTSRAGFTLIELMIAMTIFAVMSVIVMSVYLNMMTTSRRLSLERHMTETARQITEKIAEDVREYGISDGWTAGFDPTSPLWNTYNYTESGSEFLGITTRGAYVYGYKTDTGMNRCIWTVQTDPQTHCGLYFVLPWDNWQNSYNLVDSFIPEEDRKRVKIEDLKFYISWWEFTTKKVTLVMTLGLMPRSWVPSSMIANTKYHIQTTISERGWQKKQ